MSITVILTNGIVPNPNISLHMKMVIRQVNCSRLTTNNKLTKLGRNNTIARILIELLRHPYGPIWTMSI